MQSLLELADFRFRLRSFLSFSEKAAEAMGITMQQYQMLQVIEVAGPAGCSISTLAQKLLLRHNSAVELVDRGERSGLVRRVADETDLRRSLLQMTDRGRNVLVRLVREHLDYMEKAGPEMLESLRVLLEAERGADAAA